MLLRHPESTASAGKCHEDWMGKQMRETFPPSFRVHRYFQIAIRVFNERGSSDETFRIESAGHIRMSFEKCQRGSTRPLKRGSSRCRADHRSKTRPRAAPTLCDLLT